MTKVFKKGEQLDNSILFATTTHHGQFDQGGNPYILHCFAVMFGLNTTDEELQCMSILHDTVEDGKGVTYAQLSEIVSERVVEGVRVLTKVPGESYDDYKQRVFASKDAMLVKLSDLRHNSDITRIKGLRDKDFERTIKYMKFYSEIQCRLTGT